MNNFYVYMYSDPKGVPFYIGKGKGNRWRVSNHLRSKRSFLKSKIINVGADNVRVKFLYMSLSEEQAFYLEEYYIAGIGRRDLDLGPLCNMTNGGDGSAHKQSEETKRIISKAMMGNQYPLGYKHSEATKRRLSIVSRGRNVGRIRSSETRRKLSETHLGHMHSEETKRKMSITRKGRALSENHKQQIKESWKKRKGIV